MALDYHSFFPGAEIDDEALAAERRERLITVAGTTLAVLVVAAIAVLMGMA